MLYSDKTSPPKLPYLSAFRNEEELKIQQEFFKKYHPAIRWRQIGEDHRIWVLFYEQGHFPQKRTIYRLLEKVDFKGESDLE